MVKDIFFTALFLFFFIGQNIAQKVIIATNDSIRAEKDVIDLLIKLTKRGTQKEDTRNTKKVFFSLMPLSGGSSKQGVAVSTINASFYMGDPASTKLSNVSFYPSTNFSSYFQFRVTPNLWLSKNSWNIPGNFEIARMKQNTYGLGANSSADSINIIHFNSFNAYSSINHETWPDFFIGLGYSLDYYYNIAEEWDNSSHMSSFGSYPYGTSSGSFSSGITFNFLYDNRRNPINSLQGFYSNFAIRINSPVFGSDYKWNSLYFDTRKYFSFSTRRHNTLALWCIYWATWGEVPYLNLPGTGLDYSGWTGRGYPRARYRGRQLLYGETEFRFDLARSGLWGGVVFMNVQSYTEPETEKFQYVKPAAGFGLRLKFNKYSDSNITCDFAFGKESFNWYMSLNEAF
jgi:hypothetical protein